jgi:hypothetical protein
MHKNTLTRSFVFGMNHIVNLVSQDESNPYKDLTRTSGNMKEPEIIIHLLGLAPAGSRLHRTAARGATYRGGAVRGPPASEPEIRLTLQSPGQWLMRAKMKEVETPSDCRVKDRRQEIRLGSSETSSDTSKRIRGLLI